MGRMLEALKRIEEPKLAPEPKLVPEPVLVAANPEPAKEEPAEDEMPFVEVGGPRTAAGAPPRLEMPSPRAASLHVRPPAAVALHACPQPAPARPRVAAELVVFHQPEHPVSQQYAALFGQLTKEPVDDTAPAFLFTSLAPGAGTTTSLLNLAIAGCRQHAKRIVIVDANHERSAAAARLGVAATLGLNDVLQGKVALEKAVLSTPVKNLHLLPAGSSGDLEDTSADAFRWVTAWLRQRFDLVLVDAPPWEGSNNLRTLLPAASAVYLVVDPTETEQPAVRAITRDAARLGTRLGGLIVTQ